MKLSMSFAQTIIDEVQSGAELYEVQILLNNFLAEKVKQTTRYDITEDGGTESHLHGDMVFVNDLLTDN